MALNISPQLGLAEDDIIFRLSLLSVNVIEPLKNKFPNLYILGGFREVTSGVSQHERGEAVDISIQNASPLQIFNMAVYLMTAVPFDQLVLNFSSQTPTPWIHVSFSPYSLRRQVLTKNYDDSIQNGLHLASPLTGIARQKALTDRDIMSKVLWSEMTTAIAKNERLAPVVTFGDAVPSANTTGEILPGGGDNDPVRAEVVTCVKYGLTLPAGLTNEQKSFEIVKRVAWVLRSESCGLLVKTSGENIIEWNGFWFSTQRVCYPDGRIYDILGGASGGENIPQWFDNGTVALDRYYPAMEPDDAYGADWKYCQLGE